MAKRFYSDEEKSTAVELSQSIGIQQAADMLGIPYASIRTWRRRGVPDHRVLAPTSVSRLLNLPAQGDEPIEAQSSLQRSAERTRRVQEIAEERRERTERARKQFRENFEARREALHALLLENAIESLQLMDEPHQDFKGKDATPVTYAIAPPNARQNYATTAAILIDKLRLERGESSQNISTKSQITTTSVNIELIQRLAEELNLPVEEVLAESERLLALPAGADDENVILSSSDPTSEGGMKSGDFGGDRSDEIG